MKLRGNLKKGIFLSILIIGLFFIASFNVKGAATTQLSISIEERIHLNRTFAENFDLNVTTKRFQVTGTINISNPSSNNLFDINVLLNHTDNISSNFSNISGNAGWQKYFPKHYSKINNTIIVNTTQNQLFEDIDEDGIADLVWCNSTHLIFNATSQREVYTFRFRNMTNSSITIINASADNQFLNFNYSIIAQDDPLTEFASINVYGAITENNTLSSGIVSLNDTNRTHAVLFIPMLNPGNWTLFNYTVNVTHIIPPLNISSDYFQLYSSKVITEERLNITDVVKNQIQVAKNITGIIIDMNTQPVRWNDYTGSFDYDNFTFSNIWNTTNCNASSVICGSINNSDFANVTITNNETWRWNIGNLMPNEQKNISYEIKAPNNVPNTGTYYMIKHTLWYRVNDTISDLNVQGVNVSAKIEFNFTKEMDRPQNTDSNHNATWSIVPYISTPLDINFTIYRTSIWVSDDMNPNNKTGTEFEKNYSLQTINASTPWKGTAWEFNYTDGSSGSYPPPIVWMKPKFYITHAYNQIINYTLTYNQTDIYMKYIYVIHGYWLEVYKNVTLIPSSDLYNITIVVHNRGNGWTPNHTIVTVFDFVPEGFVKDSSNFRNSSQLGTAETTESIASAEFKGTAVKWDIGWLANRNASFSPKINNYPFDGENDTWMVTYMLNGAGRDYVMSDVYIVGLDPKHVDGAFTTPFIAIISGLITYSSEYLFIIVVVMLVVLNSLNFVLTQRINKNLNQQEEDKIKKDIEELKQKLNI